MFENENRLRLFVQQKLIQTSLDGSESFFDALAQHLGEALGVDYVVIDRQDETPGVAETVALYAKGAIVPNLRYDLKGTPCENVMGRKFCFYPQGIQHQFPDDALLVEMGAESYAGIPLWDSAGESIGLIAVLNSKPFSDEGSISRLLQLVAIRAAAELERERSDRVLREREQEFRSLAVNLPDNIARWDRAGRYLYLNPTHEWTMRTPAAEALGKRASEIFSDGRFDRAEQVVVQVAKTGQAQSIKVPVLRDDGSLRIHEVSYVPERNALGEIVSVLGIGRDMTERKRMEEERQGHLHFFESMDRINRTILGSSDMETVLNEVLDTVLAIFDCDRAFLCYPCDPEADFWSVPMERTRPEYPGALALGLAIPMDADVATTFRMLLDADAPVTQGSGNQHPLPKEVSEQFGFNSQISMAIYPKSDKSWHFGIQQCSGTRAWTVDEQKLFQEIGRRLADALTSLLMYRNLCASEQKFRSLAESMPDNIVRYNRERVTVYVNPVLERTLGDSAAAMIGTTPREYHPDGSYEDYAQLLDTVLASGEAGELEKILLAPDGKTSIHQIRMVAERGEDGEVVGVLTIGRDITERKRMEETLASRERELRALAESSPGMMGSFYLRPDGSVCMPYVSQKIWELFGLHPQDVVNDASPLLALNHPDDAKMVQDSIAESAHALTPWHVAYRILHPTKGERWMESNTNPEPHPDGGVIWYGYVHDITERKQAEKELRESENRFRSLFESATDCMLILDMEGRIVDINRTGYTRLGYQEQEMLGRRIAEFDTPECAAMVSEHMAKIAEKGKATFESAHVRKDGTIMPIEISSKIIHLDGEQRYFSVIRDITERKHAERQLRELTMHIQTVREEEKAHLAREIHDDLCSTLAALKMDANWLARKLPAETKMLPLLKCVESMNELLNEAVKAMRRIITDLRPPALDDLGLMEALEWQAEQFQKHNGIECRVACIYREGNGCKDCKDCEYTLDKMLSINLFRIFQESLTNVARHSGASRVEVELQPCNHEVVLSIRDNGRGLPEGHVIASTSYGMRGMRERVEQLSGKIEFDQPLGGGFRVMVRLPQPAAH